MSTQVSIHASRCREAMRARLALPLGLRMVSIHASRCREAMLMRACALGSASAFQSTPPVAGRRCIAAPASFRRPLGFQSTPPVAGRRCLSDDANELTCFSFNPRLPLPGGDANEDCCCDQDTGVSIHASRCREAMLQGEPVKVNVMLVSIHASRCREAMPADNPGFSSESIVSIHASRCREAMPHRGKSKKRGKRCFNPRLPLPGGDAVRAAGQLALLSVSIHASRCREAMPAIILRGNGISMFQSTPPVAGRRCP